MNYYYPYNTGKRQNESLGIANMDDSAPESLRNTNFTPGFLRQHLGKLVRVEFLIGTTGLTDRTGLLVEVGASYIVLRSIQDGNLLYCDIYSIKFVTISEMPYLLNPDFEVYAER